MELTLDQALQKGIEAHKAGQVQEADQYYTAILKSHPKHPDANHNMGVLATGVGKLQEALPFFETALEANSDIAQFWLSYIDTLIKLNQMGDAKAVFDQAKIKGMKGEGFDKLEVIINRLDKNPERQDPPVDKTQNLINLYNNGKLSEALTIGTDLIKQFPGSSLLRNIYGAINAGLGYLDKAVEAYNTAVVLNPQYADAYNNMGNALRDKGLLGEAINAYNTAISINPKHAEAYNNMGITLRSKGMLDEAKEAYTKAIQIKADHVDAYNNMSIVFKDQFKFKEATQACKKSISINPKYALGYSNLGNILRDQGKLKDAIEAYKQAININPNFSEAYTNLGIAWSDLGKYDKAVEAHNHALDLNPNFAEGHRNLSLLRKYSEDDRHLITVEQIYNNHPLTIDDRCRLSFALTKMYEDIGKFDKAFTYLAKGNALRKKILNYSIADDTITFSQIKHARSSLVASSIKLYQNSTCIIPIFILGMPRSGTTLAEQVISSHSKVTGAGELQYIKLLGSDIATGKVSANKKTIKEFRKKYLSMLSEVSNDQFFVVDKMPHNFLYLGLICSAFPEAKIIYTERNAPATCWSNYRQYFASNELGYCYSLRDIINYYRLYEDLTVFWQSKYSSEFYNLSYEKMVENPEYEIKNIIKYLELDWEDACLAPQNNLRAVKTASSLQVKQKIYKGSDEVWRNYEQYLDGAFDVFENHC